MKPASRLRLFHPRAILLSLAALILAMLPALASEARAAERARIEAFLQITGFDVALDSIALSAGDAPLMLGMDPGAFGSEWKRLADDVFDTGVMRGLALDILEQTLTDDLLTHAAAFYAGDLGQRLVEAENRSHMLEDDSVQKEEGGEIVSRLLADRSPRLDLFERMIDAIDASETGLKALQEIQFRFLLAASAAGVIDLNLDAEALRELLARNEDQMRTALREAALAGSAYTYREFADSDVAAYVEALEQPEMQQVYALLNAVQYEIMANRFEVLAGRMAGLRPGRDI